MHARRNSLKLDQNFRFSHSSSRNTTYEEILNLSYRTSRGIFFGLNDTHLDMRHSSSGKCNRRSPETPLRRTETCYKKMNGLSCGLELFGHVERKGLASFFLAFAISIPTILPL